MSTQLSAIEYLRRLSIKYQKGGQTPHASQPIPLDSSGGSRNLRSQINNLALKYQQGGQVPKPNPYYENREDWGEKLSYKFPNGTRTVNEIITEAAKRTGIDPGLLYTSAMEEGMGIALSGNDPGNRRSGYKTLHDTNPKKAKEYPIDGGYFYGLNTFGDKYGVTIKRSLFPEGFKFEPYKQYYPGVKDPVYTSAAFRSHDDAIAAKSAMMRQVQDALEARYKRNNITLSPEARKFFDMVGYNMGEDKTVDMVKSYQEKGYLDNDRFLAPDFEPVSWKQPYTQVQRRYQNYLKLKNDGYFGDPNIVKN